MAKNQNRKSRQHQKVLVFLAAMIIALLILLILLLLALPASSPSIGESSSGISSFIPSLFQTSPKIPDNVSISGIDVSGMTQEKAFSMLLEKYPNISEEAVVLIRFHSAEIAVMQKDVNAGWDIAAAIEGAMAGRSAAVNFTIDRSALSDRLMAFMTLCGGIYSPSGYWLEGDRPDLDTQAGACQTLVLLPGSSGWVLSPEDIMDEITAAFRDGSEEVSLTCPEGRKEAAPLDLSAIYSLVSIPPQNPYVDKATLDIIPGRVGYSFDMDLAREEIADALPGAQIRLSMEYVQPAVSGDEVWFQDELGSCKTGYTDNANRNNNLRLACDKLNGIILQPGQTLSYNETLGKRTSAAGYLPAPAYVGTELVDELGGGICQVSSTLYLSSLFAELTIVERKNHGYPVSYIPLGLDATVNWGTTDLKIRNDYNYAVKILAEVGTDGFVSVRIMGFDQRDYTVKMEYRVDDHPSYAAAYRCRYSLENGEEIYRKLDHTSVYLDDVWCWPGYAESGQEFIQN